MKKTAKAAFPDSAIGNELQLHRNDRLTIQSMIPDGARILDLGCGSGRLLKVLKHTKHAAVTGVERDQAKILECAVRGVPVIHANLDESLQFFSDNSYDYVILSRTLQSVQRPDLLLEEMLRIGRCGIVSFMNFGHINNRIQLMFGNMPVTRNLPRPWYDNQTIHPGTISDLRNLCKTLGIRIVREIRLSTRGDILPGLGKIFPNLFASNCIFILAKGDGPEIPCREPAPRPPSAV